MDDELMIVFQRQVHAQAWFGVTAYQAMSRALQDDGPVMSPLPTIPPGMRDPDQIAMLEKIHHLNFSNHMMTAGFPFWAAVQSLLTACANISKALWGQGGKLAEARRPLRESLSVSDSSALKGTLVRNKFEHIDECVDEWYADPASRVRIVDTNIMNLDPPNVVFGGPPIDHKSLFRNYNPETGVLTFWGNEFDTTTMVLELSDLHITALRILQKRDWPAARGEFPPV